MSKSVDYRKGQTGEGDSPGAPALSVARLAVVQALYQMEASGIGIEAVIREFKDHRLDGDIEGERTHRANSKLVETIARQAIDGQLAVDQFLTGKLSANWRLSRLDSTVRAILRAGVSEMMSRQDVPTGVIIDEYIEIAKSFFDDGEEPGFINGVLDAAVKDLPTDDSVVSG